MERYIDADRLCAEIERLKGQLIRGACAAQIEMETNCKDEAYNEVLTLIYSLLQEQTLTDCNELQEPELDLEKEVEKYFQGLWPGMETAEQCNTDMHFTPPAIMRLAKHFYILGLKNNIPVTQITLDELAKEGEPVTEDLEKEIENTIDNTFCDMNGIAYLGINGYATVEDMKYIARHFYNLGKNAK